MRLFYILSLVLSCLIGKVFAQGFELQVDAGMSNYFGELQKAYFTTEHAKPYVSSSIKYGFNSHIFWRAGISIAGVSGYDNPVITDRNLNFSSKIQELNTGFEIRFISPEKFPVTPYVFVCIGVFHFNPTTIYNGEVVDLQPLGTEGQGLPQYPMRKMYSRTQLCIPFGGGAKWKINDNVNIGFEFGVRKIFTDYLDDISEFYADKQILLAGRGQTAVDLAFRTVNATYPLLGAARGSINNNDDWYYFLGLSVGVRLFNPESGELSLGGLIRSKWGRTSCSR